MLHCFMLASLLNVLLWYSMCSLKTLSDIIYLPHKFQIKCFETIFLLNVALCFSNAPSNSQQKRMQSHTGCIGLICRPTLSLLWWQRQACDSSKLNLFPHISQDSSSGWDLFLWLYLRSKDACQASGKPKNDARRSFAIAFLRDTHPKKNMQDHARYCENVIKSSILIVTKESQVFNQFSCQTCGAVHFLF